MNLYKFSIEIPNTKLKIYEIITFIILSLNVFGFGYVFLKTVNPISFVSIILLIINAIPWGYFLLNKKHINFKIVAFSLILSAIGWSYLGNNIMCVMLLLFAVFGYFTNKRQVVYFYENGIVYPSFPSKNIKWNTLTQVICKDAILTIDFKNNKLVQLNIDEKLNPNFDEKAFNDWCANFLKQTKTK